MSSIFLFFFFQAEDGIRDSSVTGVQTCALPILGCRKVRALPLTCHERRGPLGNRRSCPDRTGFVRCRVLTPERTLPVGVTLSCRVCPIDARFAFMQGHELNFRNTAFGERAFEVCMGLVDRLGG